MFDAITELLIFAGLVVAWLAAWAWKIWGPGPTVAPPRLRERPKSLREDAPPPPLRAAAIRRPAAPPAVTAAGRASPVFRMMRGPAGPSSSDRR